MKRFDYRILSLRGLSEDASHVNVLPQFQLKEGTTSLGRLGDQKKAMRRKGRYDEKKTTVRAHNANKMTPEEIP